MHTTPNTDAPNQALLTQLREAQAESRLVMERVQTKALETLESLMDEPEPTGDPKRDAFIARERNRRRMAATQALTHIRSVQREERNAAKAEKQKSTPTAARPVPLAARPPVQGHENQSSAETPPPTDASPPEFTTLDLQRDWLLERREAMAKARAKQKSKKRRKR